MLITCDNKGCLKSSNALLNADTQDVLCGECGKSINNVSSAMKRTLKSFGQVVRTERKAFMLACGSCKANREVVMDQDNNTICKTCHEPMKIHAAFKLAMEEAGGLEKIDTTKKKTKKKKKVNRKKATK
jgi:pyruvate dehydrogenase complex dehydrogenase (E1) component